MELAWPRTARLNSIHEVLAGVEASKGYALEDVTGTLTELFYEMSEAFFILLRWDQTYWELLEATARAGCRSTVLLVGAAAQTHSDKDDTKWADVVKIVSPDDIRAGRMERL